MKAMGTYGEARKGRRGRLRRLSGGGVSMSTPLQEYQERGSPLSQAGRERQRNNRTEERPGRFPGTAVRKGGYNCS